MERLIRFLQWAVKHHPKKIVLLHLLCMVGAGVLALTHLRIDTSVDGLMSGDVANLADMLAVKTEFSNDEVTIVAIDLGHRFTRDDLTRLARVTERLEEVPAVHSVMSLTNIEDVRSDGAGGIDASPLLDRERLAALDDAGLALLQRRVASHPLYVRNLVSRELDVLALVVAFEPPTPGKLNIREATDRIGDILAGELTDWAPYWVAGYPALEREADQLVKQDLLKLAPLVFVVLLLIFYGVARRLFSVLLICTLGLWTSAVAVAYFALTDTPFNIVTSAVPAILLTTSAVYGIFLLGMLQTMRNTPEPAMKVIEICTRPSFLAMFSTAAGFLSMLFIDVKALQEMGLGLAIGTVGCFIAELSLLPALIQLVRFEAPPVKWQWVDRFATYGVKLARHPWRVLAGVALVIAACIPGLAALRIDTNVLDYYRDTSTTRRAHDFVRDKLGGGAIVSVIVRTDRPGGALTPEVARLAEALTTEAAVGDVVDHVTSLLDYNELMETALAPGESPRRVLPSEAMAAQYLMLYEMSADRQDLEPYLNHDRSAMALRLRISNFSSATGLDLERRMLAVADAHPEAHATVRALSSAFLLTKSADSIASGVIPGFAVELVVVFFVFLFTLRSFKLALIAIPPNVLPSIFCMAALGYSGIPISIGSSLVGFIAVGLAIDDTAHILAHLKDGHSMRRVYSEVGMPVVLTSMALGLSFLVLSASSFQVLAVFGVATGITLATAVLGDIIMLPSILRLLGYQLEDGHQPAQEAEAASVVLAEPSHDVG